MNFLKNIFVLGFAAIAPIHGACAAALVLIFVDLILGIQAAKARKEHIRSGGMRRTISKILVYEGVLLASFVTDTFLLGGTMLLVKAVSALIGLVEFKSILEKANDISGKDLFRELIKKLGSDNDKPKDNK